MGWLLRVLVALLAMCGAAIAEDVPEPVMAAGETEAGSLRVEPETGISGEYGTWTVSYAVGEEGIRTGGGIRVQLPDAWHSGIRNSANDLQATDPKADHFVSAKASAGGVRLRTVVEHESDETWVKAPRPSLDGRNERFVFVVRVLVEEGNLQRGDTISVVYGDTSGGSRGYRASSVSTGPQPVLVAVDAVGDSRFVLHAQRPTIAALPGKAVEMLFHAPSVVAVGEKVRLLVSLVDKEENPAAAGAMVDVACMQGRLDCPTRVEVPAGQGYVLFEGAAHEAGVVRLTATARELGLTALANPMDVRKDAVERRIYWGDLHSHTRYSWDGVGDDAYDYARYTSGLDFYAMTDHSKAPKDGMSQGLNRHTWKSYLEQVEAHNTPHAFVTIPAYECSFGEPYGHHNVYFRREPGPLLYPSETTLPALWKALKAGDALTIPHHTGKMPRGIDLSVHDPAFRRNIEIYSAHGLSEVYNPEHPLSFEHSDFTSEAKSVTSPTYAQDAWAMGQELSTIASSDDHRAHPGQPHFGLAAVMAPELTREAIFQGLYDRFTYGTTGSKIILEMDVNGAHMGQAVRASGAAKVRVRVVGTDVIESVGVLRFHVGEKVFSVVDTQRPDAAEYEGVFEDGECEAGDVYYVRVTQRNTVRGRAVMAWSSPVWVLPAR